MSTSRRRSAAARSSAQPAILPAVTTSTAPTTSGVRDPSSASDGIAGSGGVAERLASMRSGRQRRRSRGPAAPEPVRHPVLVEEGAHLAPTVAVGPVEALEQGLVPIALELERLAGEHVERRDLERVGEFGGPAVVGEVDRGDAVR